MLKVNDKMECVVFETIEDGRPVKKIAMKHAEILTGKFRDFVGKLNGKGNLIRSFVVSVPVELIPGLQNEGIPVGFWKGADAEDDEEWPGIITIKINYTYSKQPVIEVKEGADGAPCRFTQENIHLLQSAVFDDAFITARVVNGVTDMGKPYTSLYLANAGLVKHKDEMNPFEAEMFSSGGFNMDSELPGEPVSDEEELPFS